MQMKHFMNNAQYVIKLQLDEVSLFIVSQWVKTRLSF
jgi:hypothetical protein